MCVAGSANVRSQNFDQNFWNREEQRGTQYSLIGPIRPRAKFAELRRFFEKNRVRNFRVFNFGLDFRVKSELFHKNELARWILRSKLGRVVLSKIC